MKKCDLWNMRLLIALVVGLMLLSSCAKDEPVCPANVEVNGMEKNSGLLPPTSGDPMGIGGDEGNGRGKSDPDPGDTISDDGDDLSDKERSNKKKVN